MKTNTFHAKKILVAFFAVLMPLVASAEKVEIDGIWYNLVSKVKQAEVTYKGDYYNSYNDEYSGSITIPATVTYDGVAYSVTSIGEYAFRECTSLTAINIPENSKLTSIGDYAFSGCSSLTAINIPEGVTSIGDYAFYYCRSLTAITIPESVTSIGEGAFYYCVGELTVNCNIPSSSSSSNSPFYESNFSKVTIGDKVTSIGDYAFYYCRSLTTITIPESVTSIGDEAFSYCRSLTTITIPASVTSIGDYAFYDCKGELIVNCNIPSSSFSPFYKSKFSKVTIGDKVTSIGNCAFYNCSSFTDINIPESVTSIGKQAFSGCSSLTAVHIGSIDAWCKITFGDYYSNPLRIAHNLYLNGELVTELVIPESVTSIGDWAFHGCSSLTAINIPNSVTSIGIQAFSGCSSLTAITIPESVTSIGRSAFYGCVGELTVNCNIPSSSSSSNSPFNNSKFSKVTIGDKVTSIGDYAFSGCTSLTAITIPESVTNIGAYAFSGCSSLKELTLGEGLKRINAGAFADSDNLEKITIYASQPPAADGFIFSDATYANATLYVPQGCVSKYQMMTGWSGFETILPITCVSEISLSPTSIVFIEGDELTLTATITPDYAIDQSVTWTTSDESIATVDDEGKVTAIAPGTATITATANDGSGVSAQCEVTVKAKRASVVITDPCNEDSFIQEVNEENVDISYTRKLSKTNTWYALYVPFEIPVTEELLDDYDVAYFNDIHSYDEYVGDKADGITGTDGVIDRMDMEVLRVQEGMTLNANYPYLIRAKHEDALNMNIEVESTTLYKSVENTVSCSSVFMKFDVTGIYTTQTAGELKGEFDVYAMSGGGWKQALNDEQQLKPFRLYLRLSTISGSPVKVAESAMKAIRIRVDGEDDTTGLEDSELKITDSKLIFDLQGRRVENPGKGIYIVNGKKTVIK